MSESLGTALPSEAKPWASAEELAEAMFNGFNAGRCYEWDEAQGTTDHGDWLRAARVALSRPVQQQDEVEKAVGEERERIMALLPEFSDPLSQRAYMDLSAAIRGKR